jgi:hypothetical protein
VDLLEQELRTTTGLRQDGDRRGPALFLRIRRDSVYCEGFRWLSLHSMPLALLGPRASKAGSLARTFVVLNAAAVVGLWRFLTGSQRVTW